MSTYTYCDAMWIIMYSGGGKSSTVNLLLGKTIANVSNGAVGCTSEFQCYEGDNEKYVLFDTPGLSEGSKYKQTSDNHIIAFCQFE